MSFFAFWRYIGQFSGQTPAEAKSPYSRVTTPPPVPSPWWSPVNQAGHFYCSCTFCVITLVCTSKQYRAMELFMNYTTWQTGKKRPAQCREYDSSNILYVCFVIFYRTHQTAIISSNDINSTKWPLKHLVGIDGLCGHVGGADSSALHSHVSTARPLCSFLYINAHIHVCTFTSSDKHAEIH